MKKDWDKAAEYPYARVKDDPRFLAHAKANQWADRRDKGYPWRTNMFQFIANVYGEWLDTGKMIRADLIEADVKMYSALNVLLSHGTTIPSWLKLPSAPEAALAKASDPEEREFILLAREVYRRQKAMKKEKREP